MSRSDESGSALTVTLLAMALLVPLGALAVLQARTGLQIAQDLRSEREAFYAADAGLSWAVASLPPDVDDATLLAGPDGLPDTADDGIFPFAPNCTGCDIGTSLRFEVSIALSSGGLWTLTSAGFAPRRAKQVTQLLLRRSPRPHLPGALYAQGQIVPVFGASGFVINGYDHGPDDEISPTSGRRPGLPALALPSASLESTVRDGLSPDAAGQLIGPGDPSVGHDQPVNLESLAWRAAAKMYAVLYEPSAVPVDLSFGTSANPRVTIINGDAVVEGTWSGTGILIVRGRLEVRGTLELNGLLLGHDGLLVEDTAAVRIRGAALLAGTQLDLWGSGGIAACSSCLDGLDASLTDVLPHPFEPLSWRQADPF